MSNSIWGYPGQTATATGGGTGVVSSMLVTVDDLPTSGIVSAHRGGGNNPYVYPDGSMSAYRYAHGVGVSMIDMDIQRAADGTLVVMHDTTVDRTTAGTGLVSTYPAHLLPFVDMRYASGEGWTPEPVPTVHDVLRAFGGKIVLTLEAKSSADVPILANLIRSYELERSVFINVNHSRGSDIRSIVAAGCLAHAWGLTTTTHVQTADSNGAWLIELPYNASTTVVNAARATTNTSIKRVVAGPIYARAQLAALTAGLQGHVTDAVGHTNRASGDAAPLTSIATHISRQRIGAGWRSLNQSALNTTRSLGYFTTDPAPGITLLANGARRRIMFGDLSGTRAASGSITYRYRHTATSATHRSDFRVMVPDELGEGEDSDTRGYVIGCRQSGELVMWTIPSGFGAGISLGTATSPAVTATDEVRLRFSWDATTVTLTRLDAAGATLGVIGPITNSDWRGAYITAGSQASGGTRVVLTGLDVA